MRLAQAPNLFVVPVVLLLGGLQLAAQEAAIQDMSHYSHVFGEERHFRVFLPPGYESNASERYPTIYFFHGFNQRFNAASFDTGYDGDNIATFVGRHRVIVVRWDGYNPRTPGEKYVRPYNVLPVETYRQFPLYFPELVAHIDANFRTIPDRNHRATAGLSMGGFMSFWVAGKYPHLVGSASNFMGSSEFFAGPNGFPSEYRHTEMYGNYEGLRTRIVIGTRDFIRWYHRRMNAIWNFALPNHEHEEFDWDHGTPGMSKTLGFHMAAFRNPLPKPAQWRHADIYPAFEVWGHSVSSDRRRPGFTTLENVSASGFRIAVREWLPSGAALPAVSLRVATDAIYEPGAQYAVVEANLEDGEVRRSLRKASPEGRLHFALSGAPHEVGISREGTPVLAVPNTSLPAGEWAVAGKPVRLGITVLNKGSGVAQGITATAASPNPGVVFKQARLSLGALAAGRQARPAGEFVFTVQDPEREIVKLIIALRDKAGRTWEAPVEIPLLRDAPELAEFRVLDGARAAVWRRAVRSVEEAVGAGDAGGTVNPGETIAIAMRDGEALRLAELFANDACVDMRQRVSDLWPGYDSVGASAKISLPAISAGCPEGHEIRFFARFQMPNKPEHVLREGVVRVKVAGRDRTPPQVAWAGLSGWNKVEVDIRDGGRIRSAEAALRREEAVLKFSLNDEGRNGDAVARDGVFTGLAPNPPPGRYKLIIVATDESGNSSETAVESEFEFTLAPPSPAVVR